MKKCAAQYRLCLGCGGSLFDLLCSPKMGFVYNMVVC